MATAPATTTESVLTAISDGEMPLADLLKKVTATSVGRAWARGAIQFGRPNYCVEGPVGKGELVIEGGVVWTGPKAATSRAYSDFPTDPVPAGVVSYRKAGAKDPLGRDEAVALLALRVKLTDAGLAALDTAE